MGLDMYIYRIRKPQLEERVYTEQEISDMGLSSVEVDYATMEKSLYEQLLPYMTVRNVIGEYINKKKIIKDYNLPKDSFISMLAFHGIELSWDGEDGSVSGTQFIPQEELDKKYITTKTVPTYIWRTEEEKYWRKHYELQDWFYEKLGNVENCGYYVLDADLIAEMNAKFDEHVFEEDPTDDEALVYHEWY